jgi:hypothetical protein
MHISYSLHLIDCNLADGEYILVPEQGVAQEVVQELAQSLPSRICLPQPWKASLGFMHNLLYMLFYCT